MRCSRPRMTSAARSMSARSIIATILALQQNGVRGERGAPAGPARRPRRPGAEPAHGLLPALPRDPALHLGDAARHRGVRRRLRQLAGGARSRARCRTSLHDFVAAYIRYATQVSAYVFLAANPYPWFRVPVRLPGRRRDRPAGAAGALGRLLPAGPRAAGAAARDRARRRLRDRLVGPGLVDGASSGNEEAVWWNVSSVGGVAAAAAFLAWFAILARGRAPRGLRDLDGVRARVRGAGGCVPLPAHSALSDVGPGARRAVLELPGAPGAHGRDRRPRAAAAHRPLPPLPRDPPLRLARCCGRSRSSSS